MTDTTVDDLWSDYLHAASSTDTDQDGLDLYDIEGMNDAAHDIYLALVAAQSSMSEQTLQYLATSGQAADAYTAQMEAESAIDAAVLAERERCAKVAFRYHDPGHTNQSVALNAAEAIGNKIRKGPTP